MVERIAFIQSPRWRLSFSEWPGCWKSATPIRMQGAPIVWSDLANTSPSMQINLRHRCDDRFWGNPGQNSFTARCPSTISGSKADRAGRGPVVDNRAKGALEYRDMSIPAPPPIAYK